MTNEKETRILAGITEDNELYFLNVVTQRDGKPYFSMTGDTHTPITIEDAKKRTEDSLDSSEMSYLWKQAVEANRTKEGLEDWIEQVRNDQDETDAVDNSIFDITVEVDGEEYIFESNAGGQHEVQTLKHYFIDKTLFRNLMRAWKQYHMKNVDVYMVSLAGSGDTIGFMIDSIPKQNIEALAMQAITTINSEN